MIVQQAEAINIADLKPKDFNKMIEFNLCRKWIARNPKLPDPTGLCCTLFDRISNAIQGNFATKDIDFFNHKLKENTAYRISCFSWSLQGNGNVPLSIKSLSSLDMQQTLMSFQVMISQNNTLTLQITERSGKELRTTITSSQIT